MSNNIFEKTRSNTQYEKDLKAVLKANITDKFRNDEIYTSLVGKYDMAVIESKLLPNNEDLKREVKSRLKLLNKYINTKNAEKQINKMPLTDFRGDKEKEIHNCLPMVMQMAYSEARRTDVNVQDIIAFGNLGVALAAEKYFHPDNKTNLVLEVGEAGCATFSSYAYFSIKREMHAGIRTMSSIFGGTVKERTESKSSNVMVNSKTDDGDEKTLSNLEASDMVQTADEYSEHVDYGVDRRNLKKGLDKYLKSIFKPISEYEKEVIFLYLGIGKPSKLRKAKDGENNVEQDKGMKMEDIANLMGVKTPAISKTISKAYQKMREASKERFYGETGVDLAIKLLGNNNLDIPELKPDKSTYGFEVVERRMGRNVSINISLD